MTFDCEREIEERRERENERQGLKGGEGREGGRRVLECVIQL